MVTDQYIYNTPGTWFMLRGGTKQYKRGLHKGYNKQ